MSEQWEGITSYLPTERTEVERGKKETAKDPEKEEDQEYKREEKEENHMVGKVEI